MYAAADSPRRVEKRGRDLVVAPKKTRRQTVKKNGRPGRNKISAHRMAGSSVLPATVGLQKNANRAPVFTFFASTIIHPTITPNFTRQPYFIHHPKKKSLNTLHLI